MIRFDVPLVAALALGGCMLSPTDDGSVTSTTAPLPFFGYTTQPNVPVQVRAWDYAANAMADVGASVRSTTEPTGIEGGPLFGWSASRALAARFWRTGPAGGQCAAVGATTTLSSGTYNVIAVEDDWADCLGENPSAGGFYANCAADNSPVAKIYTTSWGSVAVDQPRLDLAGIVASSQITLTLDNFQPVRGLFCNSSNPAGCPAGLSGDPETYQFFAPNASSLVQAGSPALAFSITPARSDPMTIYIDNMTSNRLAFSTSGSRFVLDISFESTQPEVQMNCIRNGLCAVLGDPAVEIPTPRASISFALAVDRGRVIYTDATATFTTSSTDGNVIGIANGIGAAMTNVLNTTPSIRSAVSAALDSVIHQTAAIGTMPVDTLSIGGGVIQVRPGCPLD